MLLRRHRSVSHGHYLRHGETLCETHLTLHDITTGITITHMITLLTILYTIETTTPLILQRRVHHKERRKALNLSTLERIDHFE
jgi:hypothetical protein